MKIIIHRGTHQIGGCITEIKSNSGTRIAIDIGENLPSAENSNKAELNIDGLISGSASFDAIFITHYHGDHIGLYNKVSPSTPIYIGYVSKEIYKILQTRLAKAKLIPNSNLELIDNFNIFKIPDKITIKDIVITPIEVDHSAFDAHMFLVECDGKKILHTGDFRLHGPRGKTVIKALKAFVGKVDCLICEGTTLSRGKETTVTEKEIKDKAEQIFKDNKYVFILCSSTNIDRIAEFHKAALVSNRLFVCDTYQKEILNYIDSISRSSLYKFKNKVLSYGDNILDIMREKGFVMLVRDNYISKKAIKEFPSSTFVYSQWEGYLDEKFTEYKSLQEFVPKNSIHLHTSGHADFKAIQEVIKTVKPKRIIPIHSENPNAFKDMRV